MMNKPPAAFPGSLPPLPASRACTQELLDSPEFRTRAAELRSEHRYHRKLWELCFVAETLDQMGLLGEGRRGLGFAVGAEPLPAFFASRGCEILATDLDEARAKVAGWVDSNQHCQNLQMLNQHGLCEPAKFERLTSFRPLDMNRIPPDLRGFDFTWSCCSFEHVGSLSLGKKFILNQMECLKPGGVAVHTTEYNVSSNWRTVRRGPTVLFRKRDFLAMARSLRQAGHEIELDFQLGQSPIDQWVDAPPYSADRHLKLRLGRYVSTSFALVIRKSPHEAMPEYRRSA